jgi:hypothetical protein
MIFLSEFFKAVRISSSLGIFTAVATDF